MLETGLPILRRLRGVAEWGLPKNWAIGVMPGVLLDSDDGERFAVGMLGVVVDKGWTPRFHTFGELAFERITGVRSPMTRYVFGGTLAASNSIQLDAALFLGANDDAPDVTWTLGLSALW